MYYVDMSEIGSVVHVVDSLGSIIGKTCSFLSCKGLSLYFMCSDQHVKYRVPRGFPLTSSSLLDYHVKTICTHVILISRWGEGGFGWVAFNILRQTVYKSTMLFFTSLPAIYK